MRNAMWVGGGITGMGEIPMLGVKEKGIAKVIRDIFRNGENGFFYDPSDIGTMFHNTNGSVSVTSEGHPVGLMLDKRKGLELGPELVVNGTFDTGIEGWSSAGAALEYSSSQLKSTVTASSSNSVSQIVATTVGKFYDITCDITPSLSNKFNGLGRFKVTSGSANFTAGGLTDGVSNKVQIYVQANSSVTTISIEVAKTGYWGAVGDSILIDNMSVKELKGNHAYQTTSAARPILQNNPSSIAYDGVDDKLITGLPAPLTNATVLRAIPGVGAVVKYSQTLPMLYEDSTDHAGLLAIDRALTRSEQLRLMTELDKKAGATSFDTTTFKMFDPTQLGFYYDPNDLSTMYQDSAGTVPVTGAGQPVGLILDKSKGLTRKPVTLVNSSFDSGISGWAVGPSLSATWSNGEARIVGSGDIGAIGNTLRSSESGLANKLYKITFDATWVSGGYFQAGSPYREGLRVLPIDNGGIKKRYSYQIAQHPVSPNNVCCFAAESGAVWLIDNVSIEEIVGNHAYQTTSASRPILRQNTETGANYLEFDGSDDFLQTNNTDFSGTDRVSLFAGLRKLSDAGSGMLVELSIGGFAAGEAGNFYISAPHASDNRHYAIYSRGSVVHSSAAVAPTKYLAPISNVISAKAAIGDDSQVLRIDGKQVAQSTTYQGTGNYGNYPLYIGRRGGKSLPFTGHIYGLIGIGKLVSDEVTTTIEKELAKRVGVTLNV